MVFIRTEEEIEKLRESNLLVSRTLAEVAKHIAPGVSTLKLDEIARQYIVDHGAKPGFLGYKGFPNTLCTSINHEVVHGIPSGYELQEVGWVTLTPENFHRLWSFAKWVLW